LADVVVTVCRVIRFGKCRSRSCSTTVVVVDNISGDFVDPRCQSTYVMQGVDAAVHPHEGVLEEIVGNMVIRNSAPNEPAQVRTQLGPNHIGGSL
jgi:hypothetical protein